MAEERPVKKRLQTFASVVQSGRWRRLWWNWQTRYFEVVVAKAVQVQVLLSAPFFLRKAEAGKWFNVKPAGAAKNVIRLSAASRKQAYDSGQRRVDTHNARPYRFH